MENEWIYLDLSSHGECNYWSGYGLINGTNTKYGGLYVSGSVQHVEGNLYYAKADYVLHDYMDPGPYFLDWAFAIGGFLLLKGCVNYELEISGTIEFNFYK